MCQYSATEGLANNWHLVHLGSRAVGGSALIIVEATSISPVGRISHGDLGIWSDEQVKAFAPICNFITEQGSIPGIQLAHAGRKASTNLAWLRDDSFDAMHSWQSLAPSAMAFSRQYQTPKELSLIEIEDIVHQFIKATERSLQAGFKLVEIHMAHGYLLHEFLSPISNHRTDMYGGSLENRMRLPLLVAEQVRKKWPASLPVFVRISATDWLETGGWTLQESVEFCKRLKILGVDFIDCSSGGNTEDVKIPLAPGYQVHFAETIKKEAKMLTGAVGLITEAKQADEIITLEKADAVLLGRELLRDPYWPLHAAKTLGVDVGWPLPYLRAKN
jgi:2,4-dienoyl-CoA reductase-like NADH-dependent reductase (Old Yellow Enzyme family)